MSHFFLKNALILLCILFSVSSYGFHANHLNDDPVNHDSEGERPEKNPDEKGCYKKIVNIQYDHVFYEREFFVCESDPDHIHHASIEACHDTCD